MAVFKIAHPAEAVKLAPAKTYAPKKRSPSLLRLKPTRETFKSLPGGGYADRAYVFAGPANASHLRRRNDHQFFRLRSTSSLPPYQQRTIPQGVNSGGTLLAHQELLQQPGQRFEDNQRPKITVGSFWLAIFQHSAPT